MAGPKSASRKFQAPKGTRDFYPQDMAVRRYIESVWRRVSINHGFDEVEGPMFEELELYTHKSGPGIASEIFQVFSGKDQEELGKIRSGGDAPFALRPEFTPTLARMVAARAAELPRPIKWFAIPQHFRAERPQRGRLREFMQWNVDFIGDDSPRADAEVIATAINALSGLRLTPGDLQVRIDNRLMVENSLRQLEIAPDRFAEAIALMDEVHKKSAEALVNEARSQGFPAELALIALSRKDSERIAFNHPAFDDRSTFDSLFSGAHPLGVPQAFDEVADEIRLLNEEMKSLNLAQWCEYDRSIVRGLAYYTGTVFEIHEATGAERAIAGGGRYDNLIESFGGPSLPACGFGMGDVVLANILHDKKLLPEDVYMKPLRPHAFAIAASDDAEPVMRKVVAQLRRDGFHVRHSYKTTRNVGKLMGDANKTGALSAIIFGKDIAASQVDFKDLQSGEQTTISMDELKNHLKQLIARTDG